MKIKVVEKLDRKSLSTQLHLIFASLLDEPDRIMRGKLILKGMELLKEME